MKIICLSCGHKVDLRDAYDDYSGPIKCATCSALLLVTTEAGNVKSMAVLSSRDIPSPRSSGAAIVQA